jgi:SAM-dependent methyltransferase
MAVPGVKAFARRAHRTGAMNDPAEVARRAERVRSSLEGEGVPLAGARLVELGPGHTLGVALSLLGSGAARVSAIDTFPYAQPPAGDERFRYRILGRDGRWPLEDGEADAVYSFSVLEHVREVDGFLDETRRVLRPGGLAIHSIDLRDHARLDPAEDWLRFLRYPDWAWELMMSRRSNWCNRLRAPDWEERFARRFELRRFEPERWPLPAGIRLVPRFEGLGEEALAVSMLWVVGAKPRG